MKRNRVRLAALLLALLLAAGLAPPKGRAVLSGVYFTAVNEQLLELSSDTMPFLSGAVVCAKPHLCRDGPGRELRTELHLGTGDSIHQQN